MKTLFRALADHVDSDATLIETLDGNGAVVGTYSYRTVIAKAADLAARLAARSPRPSAVGVVTANSPEFMVTELALALAGITEVPVPLSFTRDQARTLLDEAELCLVDDAGAARIEAWGHDDVLRSACPVETIQLADLTGAPTGETTALVRGRADAPGDDDDIVKIIHTSGTTSRPKGVKLTRRGLDVELTSLMQAIPRDSYRRYLSLVPFSVLLEQMTAVHLVIACNGLVALLPADVPLIGTSAAAPRAVLPFIRAAKPTTIVVTPGLVDLIREIGQAAKRDGRSPVEAVFEQDKAPLICAGGAPVPTELKVALDELAMPVYEGYGLAEHTSVATWNTPTATKHGTVGRPLAHVTLRIADDGEVLIKSPSVFAGYTIVDPTASDVDDEGWLHTGDIGVVDDEGFLSITGRKKSMVTTAQGRNVAPEWVEASYQSLPFVRVVGVAGDGLDALHGLFLIDPEHSVDVARKEIDAFGHEQLSDIERVEVMHVLPDDRDTYETYFTMTGRPRRDVIRKAISDGELD